MKEDAARLEEAQGKFYKALLSGSPQRLVDEASEILGNPLMVADQSFRVIALSEDHGEQHDYWRRTVEGTGECSYEDYFENRDAIRTALLQREPFINRTSCPDGAMIECGISRDGNVLGFMSVFESTTPVTDEDLPIVRLLADSLSLLMRYDQTSPADANTRELNMLYQHAIEPGKGRGQAAVALADTMGIRRGPFYFVLKIGPNDKADVGLPSRLIRMEIERMLGNCRSFTTRLHLIALVGRQEAEPFESDQQREGLERLLAPNDLCVGVSYPFERLSDFHRANYQAGHALTIGRDILKTSTVYNYRDLIGIDAARMLESQCDILNLVDPRLLQMARYDREHQTEYLRSLGEVVRHNGNVTQACVPLNVHRNTLVYRLDRARELFRLDVRDTDDYAAISPCIPMLQSVAHGSFGQDGLGRIVGAMDEEK